MNSYAKVNIFLKIVGKRGEYHEIMSRFVKIKNLYDTLEFVEKKGDEEFELHGDFTCLLESNTIYKAYKAICEAGFENILKKFFFSRALRVKKNIPTFAGLGGGSSNAATFLKMINKEANLGLSQNKLANIGLHVGADVPFFIYDYNSANVSGIGEIVEEFFEENLLFELFTPDIKCDTKRVYKVFSQNYKIDISLATMMSKLSSIELLKKYSCENLNDLFCASLKEYPKLKEYKKENWFFSGSGSSFFKMI